MAPSRRNVQFQHRGSNPTSPRRPSMSEISEETSEHDSPTRNRMNGNGKAEVSNAEVYLS